MDGASRAGTQALDVRLLGPIEVERDGTRVALGGQKPRALLAVLALDPGRVVSVDRLVEALWPGEPPETAHTRSRSTCPSCARRSAPRRSLLAHRATSSSSSPRESTCIGSPAWRRREAPRSRAEIAAAAEVALREALALWRGPALADFLYEPFAQTRDRSARGAAHCRRRGADRGRPGARASPRAHLGARGGRPG